jgi:hypothetical protein
MKYLGQRLPKADEKNAEIVFMYEDERGNEINIQACVCHESWEQWGNATIQQLGENVDRVESWRKTQNS